MPKLSKSSQLPWLIVVLLVAAIGSSLVFMSHASPFATSVETESGTMSGTASQKTDATASGGRAVTLTDAAASGRWLPQPGLSWQWQLTIPVDQSVNAQVYDIDLFSNDASVVAALHAQGKKVICYMETGFWESYRSDSGSYPVSVLGTSLAPPFNDERYVDIRQLSILGPIIQARLDQCQQKGFDGIEPDGDAMLFDAGGSTSGTSSGTGFPLT